MIGEPWVYAQLFPKLEISLFHLLASLTLHYPFDEGKGLISQMNALVDEGKFTNLRNLTLLQTSAYGPQFRLPPFPNLKTLVIFKLRYNKDDNVIQQLLKGNLTLLLGLEAFTYHFSFDSAVRAVFSGNSSTTHLITSKEFMKDMYDWAVLGSSYVKNQSDFTFKDPKVTRAP